jgi:predicted regulator of Ras-like GTPase activity (Roadblock/LC7/MglB family)
MFPTFRKLFGLRTAAVADSFSQGRPPASGPALRTSPARPSQPRPPAAPANAPANISVSLAAILGRLPAELNAHVRLTDVGDAQVPVPMQKILSQIGQGMVKITFGELRHAAPPGIFTSDINRDRTPVEIPLSEILPRLDASLLSRRALQKQVVVPAEVTGPFGGKAQVVFSTASLKSNGTAQPPLREQAPISAPKPAAPAPTVAPPQPIQRMQPPAVPAAPMVPQQPISFAPPPVTPPVAPVQTFARTQPTPAAQPAMPAIKAAPAAQPPKPLWATTPAGMKAELEEPLFRKISPAPATNGHAQAPAAPAIAARVPQSPLANPGVARVITTAAAPAAPISPIFPVTPAAPEPVVFAPITPIAPEPEPEAALIPFRAVPELVPQPAAPAETRFLTISMTDLSQSWPEVVQQEITAQGLSTTTIALPFGIIELAMKQGKIAIPWRVIRSWIRPQIVPTASPHDATVLELPLKLVAPLFMAELKSGRTQKKIQIDENIPDLFSGGQPAQTTAATAPAPAPVAAVTQVSAPAAPTAQVFAPAPSVLPPPKAADTNYYARKPGEEAPEEAAPPVKKGPTPGTAFLVRYATPNEIVSKAAALEGVEGALIALPDGLLVASHIPATMNGDTIAAFLPQIFSRVSQCTKELRLGELNNLNFTVGAVPWKIFKVGAIYFAAFGRPGEPLPTAQLAGIAAELDRKAK